MTKDEVFEKVQEIFCDLFAVKPEDVKMSTKFFDEPFDGPVHLDSLDVVELIMGVEDKFGISVSEEASEKMTSIQDVVDYVSKLV